MMEKIVNQIGNVLLLFVQTLQTSVVERYVHNVSDLLFCSQPSDFLFLRTSWLELQLMEEMN